MRMQTRCMFRRHRVLAVLFWEMFGGFFVSLIGNIFFYVKFALLLLVIYELVVLVPIINKPGMVKVEIYGQIQAVKDTLAGLHAVEDTLGNQEYLPAAQDAEPQPGKTGAGKVKNTHN